MINVAFLTTWGSKCGISTYSEELCECLVDSGEVRVQVLAPIEEDSGLSAPEGIPFRLVWNRNDHNLPFSIPSTVHECDIVHVQHEYGLFQHHNSFIQMLRLLRDAGRRVVVTLHTAYPYGDWRSGVSDSIRSNSDVVIVHTPEAYSSVSLSRGSARVIRIQHGTRANVMAGDRNVGFKFLGIPEKFSSASFGGVFGFIDPGKNIHETIMAWSESAARRLIDPTKSGLIIAGEVGKNVFWYCKKLYDCKRECGFTENIFIVNKFIPRNMVRHVMAVVDYALLNTTSMALSASGQVHSLAAHGIPFAAAERPIYRDAIDAGAIPFSVGKDNQYTLMTINAIASLASIKSVRDDVSSSVRSYAKETEWPKQAVKHIKVYKELLS